MNHTPATCMFVTGIPLPVFVLSYVRDNLTFPYCGHTFLLTLSSSLSVDRIIQISRTCIGVHALLYRKQVEGVLDYDNCHFP